MQLNRSLPISPLFLGELSLRVASNNCRRPVLRGLTGPGAPLAQFMSKPFRRILRVGVDSKPLALCFEPCHLAGWRHGCLLSRAQGRLLVYGLRWCCPGPGRSCLELFESLLVSYMPLAAIS